MVEEQIWKDAIMAGDGDGIAALIDQAGAIEALKQLSVQIVALHAISTEHRDMTERVLGWLDPLPAMTDALRAEMSWVDQRSADLAAAAHIRQQGNLSLVLGAGATIAAGGPTWPRLVCNLLEIALHKGHEIYMYDRIETGTARGIKARLVRTERFRAAQEHRAREILDQVRKGRYDNETLMRGAQLCADLFKENLFQQVTVLLYPGGKREPSDVHYALAVLSHKRRVPYQDLDFPGWSVVLNYNFDSLLCDALDRERVDYTITLMRNGEIFRHGREDRTEAGRFDITHLHGFTPRQPCRP